MISFEKIKEVFLYVFFGAVGTVVNILIFVLLSEKCNVQYMVANIVAWVFSVAFAFVTNKLWVFKSKSWTFSVWIKECIQFIFARIATCVFDIGYMFVAISIFNWNKTLSKIMANAIVIIANYVFSRFFIFKKRLF